MEKCYLLLKIQSVENTHNSYTSKQGYWNIPGDWALKKVKIWFFLVLTFWNLHVEMIRETKEMNDGVILIYFFSNIFIWFTFQSSVSHIFLSNNPVSLDNLDL